MGKDNRFYYMKKKDKSKEKICGKKSEKCEKIIISHVNKWMIK